MRFGKSSKAAKALAVVLALGMTASMSVVAFGATCETTTTYNLVTELREVTSVISGVAQDSEVTYIANDANDNMVYIDQAAADGTGVATFTYSIDKDATVKTVYYGSMVDEETGYGKTTDTITTENGHIVNYGYDKNLATVEATVEGDNVLFALTIADNFALTAVSDNGVVNEEVIGTSYSIENISADHNLEFYFETVDGAAVVSAADVNLSAFKPYEEDGKNYVHAFVRTRVPEGAKYGVLFGDKAAIEAGDEGVIELEALGQVDGNFIIRIEIPEGIDAEGAYLRPYVYDGADYTYADADYYEFK